jgi:hypothetical protein
MARARFVSKKAKCPRGMKKVAKRIRKVGRRYMCVSR